MKMKRIFAAALAAVSLTGFAFAAGGDAHAPEQHEWSFAGPFGTFDRQSVQRGFQIYQEVCASCHTINLLSFRNLGEKGGPFESEEFPNPNDNPVIMQIAENWQFPVEYIDGETGQTEERAARASDRIPGAFSNAAQARASNGGAYPPDFSLLVKARGDGANYIRSLLLGYEDHAPEDIHLSPGQYYNSYFSGGAIAMAPPLFEGSVNYADGTEASMDQMAEDVVTFMVWAGDTHMEARKQLGVMVLIFLFIFSILVYLAYRQVWANVKH